MPGCIVVALVERTALNPVDIVAALGLAHPNPTRRPHAEVITRLQEVGTQQRDRYVTGQLAGLGWVAGLFRLHRHLGRRDFFSGIDEALWWVLGR